MSAAAPIVWHFAGCEVHEYPDADVHGYLETIFSDGAKCGATRSQEMYNLDYARYLGYSTVRDALREHELLHTACSEWLGFPYSPTLWAVAHSFAPGCASYDEALAEEAIVLQLQRFMNTAEVGMALNPYRLLAPGWRDEFRRRFCGWPTSVAA